MAKKCLICEKPAEYEIKGGSASYCENCAKESFSDVSFLVKVEEEAQRLKEVLKGRMID